MIRKILLLLLLILILITVVILVPAYIRYVRDPDPYKTLFLPRLQFSVFEIDSITSHKTEMNVTMQVKNKLPFTLRADSVQYQFYIDGKEVLKDRDKKSIIISAHDSDRITMPVTIFTKDLISILKTDERKHIDSVEYRLQASFFTKIIFRKKINVDIKRFLPLVYIPTASVEHIIVDSINLSRAVIQLPVKIENKNVFGLKAIDVKYKFSIEGHNWIKGKIPGLIDIKAQRVTEVLIPLRVSFKDVEKTLPDILRKGEKVKYKLELIFKIDSKDNSLRNSKVVLKSFGTVNSILKYKKETSRKKHHRIK